jgi:hypothetical protein
MQIKIEQFYARWRNEYGIARGINHAMMRNFGANYNQSRVTAKTYVEARTGLAGNDQLTPRNVGRVYNLDNTIAPAWMELPSKAFLVASTMNIVQSTCEVEFLCVPPPLGIVRGVVF